MIEKTARVIRAEPDEAWVVPEQSPSCAGCEGHCHNSAISRWFCREEVSFTVKNSLSVSAGEQVVIGIDDKALLQGSVLVYLLPVVLMISGASLGQYFDTQVWHSANEWFALAFGLIGLIAGFGMASVIATKPSVDDSMQPVLLRRVGVTAELGLQK